MKRFMWPDVDRLGALLLVTTSAVFVLFLLGVYTAAVGAGLACAGRWPLCDGAVFGLFPANVPSFVEWTHRLVAMLTGLLILASTVSAWRSSAHRRVIWAMGLVVVFLPIQIWAGAQTVLTYELLVLTIHFLIALGIFAAMVAATTWATVPPHVSRRALVRLSGSGLALVLPFVLLGPNVAFIHTGGIQAAYHGVGLLLLSILLVVGLLVHRPSGIPESNRWMIAGICGITVLALALKLLAGRLSVTPTIQIVDAITTVAVLLGVALVVTLLTVGSLEQRRPVVGRIE